jgi:hypothetical protein
MALRPRRAPRDIIHPVSKTVLGERIAEALDAFARCRAKTSE